MATGAQTKRYGLLALAALALALGWWMSREAGSSGEGSGVAALASASAAAPGGTTPKARARFGGDVDPWQAPRAAVTGTVRDEAGEPIAGAQVCAKLQDRELAQTERHPPQCATTQKDGSYRVDGLLGAEHHLFASARGYLPARYRSRRGIQNDLVPRMDLQAGSTHEGIDFVLSEGGVEVTGVVKDIAGGEIEGAWVSAGAGWWGASGASFARSDGEGRFSLWVEPPSVSVTAFAEGYADGWRNAAVPGTLVEVFLSPESVVVGKVVWADSGEPVAGARVSAGNGRFGGFGGAEGSVYSDDDGSFRVEGLEPGAYKITASGDELTGMSDEKVHVGLGQTSEPVLVKVHPAFAVRGTVLVDGKEPCSFGGVRLQDKLRAAERPHGSSGKEDGSVLVRGVLPGTYEVTVFCAGYVAEEAYPDLVLTEASLAGLTWSVHAGQAIRGVVVDAGGKPVENARVSARGKAGKDPRARLVNSSGERTEPDGTFVLAGLLPGAYELLVRHDDTPSPEKPTEVELSAGADLTGITLTLPASGEVHGIVRDERGAGLAGVSVNIEGPRWTSASTNDEGRFVLQGVEAGEHRVVAQRGWSEKMRAPGATDDDEAGEKVDVRAGEITEVELVVESQDGRITGRVLAEGGEPVADAFVEAVRESDSAAVSESGGRSGVRWGSWLRQPVLTDEDGRFELADLAEKGVYTIYANRKGGGEALAEHVSTGADVDLSIKETGVLAGVVRIEGGGAPARFQIRAADRVGGIHETDTFFETDGAWRLSNLPPGNYEISVEASEGNAKTEVELAEGAEEIGIELVLTPRITLKGKLVDADTGEPVAGLQVRAGAAGGNMSFGGGNGKADREDVSDAEGVFVVKDVPTGKIRLVAMSPGFTDNDYGFTWIVRRVGSEPSVQDIGSIALVKKRLDRGEEAGDLGFKTKDSEPGTEPEDVRQVVAFVRPGGPAAAAGLKVGDEIATVDGQEVTGEEAYRYGKLTSVPPGTKVSLGVRGEDEVRTVSVVAGPPM